MTTTSTTTATMDLEPVVVNGGDKTEEELLTPPTSPRPEQFGSLTSPVSPAHSLASPPSAGGAKPKRRRPIPFLFRMLRKKNKNKKVAEAEAAGLAPPGLDGTTTTTPAKEETGEMYDVLGETHSDPQNEPKIAWLQNKGEKKTRSSFFKLGRSRKGGKKAEEKSSPPRANWITKQEEPPPTPTKPVPERKEETKEVTTSEPVKGEKIDDVLVEESFVNPEIPENTRALSPKTPENPEALQQRKAIMSDSWEFYRLICGLVSDRDRYHAAFAKMQKDPVYEYLNSLTSVNDPGYIEFENFDKSVVQTEEESYAEMTKLEIAKALEEKAKQTLPEFLEICKSIAGALGVEELGIGPIKEAAWAMRKSQRKYDGDVLKVTDYCRVLLIVDDFAALLGLLELVRDSYGGLVRRVKLSTLKRDQKAKVGGYRDCIINMEVNDHICELQVHLRPLWNICEATGYKHYARCMEYKTDSFKDSYASLKGLDRKSLRELIAIGEDLIAPFPLDDVEPDQEKVIMDYFALAGLYYKVGSYSFGEIYFSRLFELRKKSFGPLHPQVTFLSRYLISCLNKQGKKKDAKDLESAFAHEKLEAQQAEKEGMETNSTTVTSDQPDELTEDDAEQQPKEVPAVDANTSFWDGLSESFQQGTNSAYDLIMDPNRKVREQEESAKAKIKESKQVWRSIRRERYPFLEGAKEEEEAEAENALAVDDATPEADDPHNTTSAPKEETSKSMNLDETREDDSEDQTRSKGSSTTPAMDHIEEKKDDVDPVGDEPKEGEKLEQTNEKEDEEVPSALDRLMENACSFCATSTTTSS